MRNDRQPSQPSGPVADRRRLEHTVAGWLGLSLVLVIIWAVTGGGPFWPGWVMLLSAAAAALRLWTRSSRAGDGDLGRLRSRGR
jgi:hypothetical protein